MDLIKTETAQDRVGREKQFHDVAFSDDRRRKLSKYYRILNRISDDFVSRMETYARGKHVLLYGCGRGGDVSHLSKVGASTVSIDISTTAISIAKEYAAEFKLQNATFLEMNAEDLGFSNCSFDLVVGRSILHHLNLEKAIDEVARVLGPGGKAIFIEPLAQNPILKMFRFLTPKMRSADERPLTMEDLKLFRSRFRDVSVKHYYLFALVALPFVQFPLASWVADFGIRLDDLIFKFLPFLRRYSWQCIIELQK